MKKLAALLLSSVMVFSLAACNNADPTDAPATDAPATEAPATEGGEETEAPVATEAPEETTTAAPQEVVTLTWMTVGGGMPANYDSWKAQLDPYLEEKIGVNINMEVVSWGDWDARRPTVVNTGEGYDIMFTNLGTYTNDVAIGAFADITELVDTASPELKEFIPAAYWDAMRVNGQIYGVPTYKDSSQSEFIVWDKAVTDPLSFDVSTIHTYEDMTPVLEAIHAETNDAVLKMNSGGANYLTFMYDAMSTGLNGVGVRFDDPEGKVVFAMEQEEVMNNLKYLHQWYNDGIINSDAAVTPEMTEFVSVMVAQGWPSAAQTTWGPQAGMEDPVAYQWGPTVISNDTVRGSLNAINANSPNPEKALEFLQLVNLDSYVRDMFYYGEQGVDWEYVGEGEAQRVHRIKTDWTMAGYTQATFFTVTTTDDVDFNQWDEVRELNENAEASVLLGFTADITNIRDQVTNCISIFERYKSELLTGTVDPEVAVPEMKAEMQGAGLDEIIAELQTQVDAFLAN